MPKEIQTTLERVVTAVETSTGSLWSRGMFYKRESKVQEMYANLLQPGNPQAAIYPGEPGLSSSELGPVWCVVWEPDVRAWL